MTLFQKAQSLGILIMIEPVKPNVGPIMTNFLVSKTKIGASASLMTEY